MLRKIYLFTSHRMRKTGSDSKVLCQKIPQGEDVRLAEKILCKALPDWKAEKEPYSQVWKYKDDIRKMHKLQEQYLFLVRHKIESAEELVSVLDKSDG